MLGLRSVWCSAQRFSSLFLVDGNANSRNHAFPLSPWFRGKYRHLKERLSLSSIFQGKKGTSDLIVFAVDVCCIIINGLIDVIPPLLLRGKITPFKNVFRHSPISPPSSLYFRKGKIRTSTACRPLTTLFDQKGQTRENVPFPPSYIFSERKGRLRSHTFSLYALVGTERSTLKGRRPLPH